MRSLPVLTAVLVLAAAACSGEAADPRVEAVADQVERVAQLLDDGEDCRALEATATLQTLADDEALDQEARSAAAIWADQARQQLSCEAPTPAPPEPAEAEDRDQGDAEGDADEDDGGDDREEDEPGPPDGPPPGQDRDDEDDDGNNGQGRGNGGGD